MVFKWTNISQFFLSNTYSIYSYKVHTKRCIYVNVYIFVFTKINIENNSRNTRMYCGNHCLHFPAIPILITDTTGSAFSACIRKERFSIFFFFLNFLWNMVIDFGINCKICFNFKRTMFVKAELVCLRLSRFFLQKIIIYKELSEKSCTFVTAKQIKVDS